MNYGFGENERVKFPALLHLLRLGYKYKSIKAEKIDPSTNFFIDIFKDALIRINNRPIEDVEIESVLQEVRNMATFNDKGKKFYDAITEKGIGNLKLIDFDTPSNNLFHVVTELTFGNKDEENFRPDIIILINGMPLAFLEVKKPDNDEGIGAEFKRMKYRLAKDEFKPFFNLIQVIAFSNNMEYLPIDDVTERAKDITQGSFYSTPNGINTTFNYFREEQPISVNEALSEEQVKEVLEDNNCSNNTYNSEEFKTNLSADRPCNAFCTSVFSIDRLMFFLKYGILYLENQSKDKHILRYPQFFAIKNMEKRLNNSSVEGKSGIIWHTQGSGKTALAVYLCKYLKDYYAKQNILARFYFVVDRLDLATQAATEFGERYFAVNLVSTKEEFRKDLSKQLDQTALNGRENSVTVVNIQKMDDDYPEVKNDYGAKIQRVIFVDEAHRSMKKTGEFYKRLRLIDKEASFIALTGTPLLSKKERTTMKFGDYIHKYFYDKSIADGYTLKIKREEIQTVFKEELKSNLDIELDSIKKKDVYESPDYVTCLGRYIDRDYKNFRIINNDNTFGGMVVSASGTQATMLQEWFEKNSELKTVLIKYDTDDNETKQKDFKKNNPSKYDLIIVDRMLTTGYDARRLKRMYLMRNPEDHSLLQTISRVNRPYITPNGFKYNYGYIVDFAGIENNQNKALEKYKEELLAGFDDDEIMSLNGLITDIHSIYEKYLKDFEILTKMIETNNMEEFSIQLSKFDKKLVKEVMELLESIYSGYVELLLSDSNTYRDKTTEARIKQMRKLTKNRLNMIRLQEKPIDTLRATYLSNNEVVKMIYEFIKVKVEIIDLSDFTSNGIGAQISFIKGEIERNQNEKDNRLSTLDEELRKILSKLEILDVETLDEVNKELAEIYAKIKKINEENEERAKKYGGEFGYVKAFQEFSEMYPELDQDKIESCLLIIKKQLDTIINVNALFFRDKVKFINSLKSTTTTIMLKEKLYQDLKLNKNFDKLLLLVYNNVTLLK